MHPKSHTFFLSLILVGSAFKLQPAKGDTGKSCPSNICNTPGCIRAAHSLIKNMDASTDPCEDFYQYACGGFLKQERIPDDKNGRSQFHIIDEELEEQLRDILEANDSKSNSATVIKQAIEHYSACMDTTQLDALGVQPFLDIMKQIGSWPVLEQSWDESKFTWSDIMVNLRKSGFGYNDLIEVSVDTDLKNSSWRTLYIDQPNLGLRREYLTKGLEDESVRHYYNYMQKVAVFFGADPQKASLELKESLGFETKLAHISMPKEERRNYSALYNPMTLNGLHELSPNVNWTNYVNGLITTDLFQLDGSEKVVLIAPNYLANLTKLLEKEPKRNVANYVFWRMVASSIGYLNSAARGIAYEYRRNITGQTASAPRWQHCVKVAESSFAAPIGKLYVTRHFKEDAKQAMYEMVADIKGEFRQMLDEVTWMDCRTKAKAYQKLRAIKAYIGYPDELLDDDSLNGLYPGLEVNSTHFFANALNLAKLGTNQQWLKLREKVDKTDWRAHAKPAIVNAFYSSTENSIQFPAGILQGVFYDRDRPNYMNYGGIGMVIGHEITHGFDDQGRQADKDGNFVNWWETETVSAFVNKTQCIIDQYGNYSDSEVNLSLNGVGTQGENIADIGGIKEAYRAYGQWVRRNGVEQVLPGLSLNQKQLFWLSAANVWCAKYRPKIMEYMIRTGAHSPPKFRIQGSFSNSVEFAQDFHCPIGSGYNPEQKCEVW